MNAGPDVQRVIAQWLTEEAPTRAPDRVLRSAASSIDRTRQRRFTTAWREPMTLSPARLAAVLAIVLVAAVSVGWLGRSSGVGAPAATPSAAPTSPASTASAVTLESYRAARDAICNPARAQAIALNGQLDALHPADSAADLATSVAVLEQITSLGPPVIDRLAALTPPPALTADHAADVTHHRDSLAIMLEGLSKLRAGQVAEANAIGDATNALSALEESYERENGLADCP